MSYVVFAAVVLLLVIVAVTILALRLPQRQRAQPSASWEDRQGRLARRRALEDQENELLQRRVELDTRRGPLGGDPQLFDALDRIEQRFRAGEIGDAEFEAEKIRLLGGR